MLVVSGWVNVECMVGGDRKSVLWNFYWIRWFMGRGDDKGVGFFCSNLVF